MTLALKWFGVGRRAKHPPDPAFPEGKDIVAHGAGQRFCKVTIPYPAPECGQWLITCDRCGLTAIVTAAGRLDDPRSAEVACRARVEKVLH
jgi:hypothetical protein